MPPDERSQELLSSGEFSRRSRLSPKALRIYDELGLLRPVDVNPSNGYRRYGVDQLRTARLIGLLRGVDMGLLEIGAFLAELGSGLPGGEGLGGDRPAGDDRRAGDDRLARHLEQLEARHSSRRSLVRHIHAILRKEEATMFTIKTRHVPAVRLMSIQRRLRAPETDAFVREAKALFARHLGGAPAAGPFLLIFHGIVDHDNDGPIEAAIPCADDVRPSEVIGIRTEAEHDEAFTTITKAEWAYPAILAAYDAVACSPEAIARPGGSLSCREVYLAEPDDVGETDLLCDIAFPLGD